MIKNSNNHSIELKDGRRLGYAEFGDRDGKPLFFFHGWPSSRLHGQRFEEAARKLKVRIISLDRPGFGLSDYKKDRTLLDFPKDVLELADYLKITKFAILGVSGGGPYAASCAYSIPQRIAKAGIMVGLGPTNIKGNLDGIGLVNKFGWANYHKFPLLRYISSFLGWFETKFLKTNLYSLFISRSDKLLTTDSFKELTYMSRLEAFKQGFKAAALDLKLYTDNWGFDLKKIKVPVLLWFGDSDKSVSVNMGKYFASQIPNSKLTIYHKEGHYLHVNHAEQILKQLTQ
ncbi:alpha/beta hydrolase [Candidatus Daviesbacteria bacterium]|nr:alpha/beta hydrolase [Candidatus Daviesbacteria bacterium]